MNKRKFGVEELQASLLIITLMFIVYTYKYTAKINICQCLLEMFIFVNVISISRDLHKIFSCYAVL